jgi:5-formyltetrahydrofolate cyclo-ligase
MPVEQPANWRHALRRELKRKRLAATRDYRTRAAQAIAANLWESRMLARKRDIAIYLAVGGEVDCTGIAAGARLRNDEPAVARKLMRLPQQLDAVIVPLLGFDNNGNRLGMGGGYYDRSFAFRKQRRAWRRPLLIGVAYSFQQVDAIQTEPWDIPLDAVITEQEFRKNL